MNWAERADFEIRFPELRPDTAATISATCRDGVALFTDITLLDLQTGAHLELASFSDNSSQTESESCTEGLQWDAGMGLKCKVP